MGAYRRILAAVDLRDDSRAVIARACEQAALTGAAVQLLHVVEFVPIEPMNDALAPVVQLDDQMMTHARARIETLAKESGLSAADCRIEAGNAKVEILRCAREFNADLIVLGSRERHGLSILVNLTEDSVLHGARCDVLAVRVTDRR